MKKFEYKTQFLTHNELVGGLKLNELGQEGWELVQVVHQYGFGKGSDVLCLLKREK